MMKPYSYAYDLFKGTKHQTQVWYNPWQFASNYFDSSTLYYKYGTRYYDRFGRWTQKDSAPSANPYVYANDDPVNEIDPSGRASVLQIFTQCTSAPIGAAAQVLGFGVGALGAALAFISLLAAGVVLGIAVSLLVYCVAFAIDYFAAPRPAQ